MVEKVPTKQWRNYKGCDWRSTKKACSHKMDCEEKQVQRFDKQIKSMDEGIKKVTTRPPRGVLTFYCILRCLYRIRFVRISKKNQFDHLPKKCVARFLACQSYAWLRVTKPPSRRSKNKMTAMILESKFCKQVNLLFECDGFHVESQNCNVRWVLTGHPLLSFLT